jgi:hypothetical protein
MFGILQNSSTTPVGRPNLLSDGCCLTVFRFYTSLLRHIAQAAKTKRLMFGSQRAVESQKGPRTPFGDEIARHAPDSPSKYGEQKCSTRKTHTRH